MNLSLKEKESNFSLGKKFRQVIGKTKELSNDNFSEIFFQKERNRDAANL